MGELEPPDSHHLRAAVGWLELGLPDEARRELTLLNPALRRHPDVLSLEWSMLARQHSWEQALVVALKLLHCDRTRATGWIHRSFALHELKRTSEAREALLPAVSLFPQDGTIPYNLACYACQLGRLDEARAWLRQAIKLDGRDTVLEQARHDTDLLPMKDELDRL
ncbi:MAG: tetratricopeptide repeat protein [Verrucomicrobiales bacterium]|nr:tetratricopeptide repeat protein [Verrucomicrobiales bacterium]